MKYLSLILAGLWQKKTRTILTVFSIAAAFLLFGMLQGINVGIDSLVSQFLDTSRLRIVSRVNRGGELPLTHVSRIENIPGISSVTPLGWLLMTYQQPKNIINTVAVDVDAWVRIYPEYLVKNEQLQAFSRTRNAALVGVSLAKKYGIKVGDRMPLQAFNVANSDGSKNWEFEVVGIYDIRDASDFSNSMLISYAYLNEARLSDKNVVNQIIVKLTDSTRSAAIATAIDELFINSASQTMSQNEKDFVQSSMNQIGNINFVINGIVSAVLFALLFLTANTMMQSLRERIPQIAILKTLGFSDTMMLLMVLGESLFLSLGAACIGLLMAATLFPALMKGLGSSVGLEGLHMPPIVFAWGSGIAVLLALASGLPPAWRARRLKIVDALAGR
jgi:putative ABC transport system permease protein